LIEVHHSGYVLAKSSSTFRVLETSHPPVFYIPPEDIMMELLNKTARTSSCEFKGMAVYFDLVLPDIRLKMWPGLMKIRGAVMKQLKTIWLSIHRS
jgi:uncharacterized protein (DUF427 family)